MFLVHPASPGPGVVILVPLRFPDHFPSFREVDGLSNTAFRLHVSALFWCSANRTDGLVTREDFDLVAARARASESHSAECVRRGAWHDARHGCGSEFCCGPFDADGWAVHDFLRYGQSKAEVDAGESGMSDGGKRGNHRRWHEQRGIVSPGCEYCMASVTREVSAATPVAKRTSGTRSAPDSGAIPRSDLDLDLHLLDKNHDQHLTQPPHRLPDRLPDARLIAATVRALWRKAGRAISDDEALYAIAVLTNRAEAAGTVIQDLAAYVPAAIRREPDVFAELLPLPVMPPVEATAADPRWDPHEYVRHPNPAVSQCAVCAMPKSNQKFHPPSQARSA